MTLLDTMSYRTKKKKKARNGLAFLELLVARVPKTLSNITGYCHFFG